MTLIPGLPDELATVPAAPLSPSDPERVEKRAAFVAWSEAVRVYRLKRQAELERDPALWPFERARCKHSAAYFVTMWGQIVEPRKTRYKAGTNPWIPFERQVDQFAWIEGCMAATDEHADGVLSKARDMGASWTMCAWILHQWLFTEPFSALLMSRKEDLVDARHPKSLFFKIDKLLEYLPPPLKPAGFNPQRHRMKLYLENPANGNVIGGESTNSNAGRGDRVTMAFLDEAAQIPELMNVWMGLNDTTEHRFAISTESLDQGHDFWDLHDAKTNDYLPRLFAMDWWENPFNDEAWYERQKARTDLEPGAFEREILRDPFAAMASTMVYTSSQSIEPTAGLAYGHGNPLYVGIDPGYNDDTAIVWLQYDAPTGYYDVLEGYMNSRQPADFYGSLLTGVAESHVLTYTDRDLELMAWTKWLGHEKPTYFGDTYGNNVSGATSDSTYSILARDYKIYVNTDRAVGGEVTANRMQARTLKGRREALRWLMPKLRFADTTGAMQVLKAVQQNRMRPTEGHDRMSVDRGPVRDWTTHFVSALEYVAVNLKMRTEMHSAASARTARQQARSGGMGRTRRDGQGRTYVEGGRRWAS